VPKLLKNTLSSTASMDPPENTTVYASDIPPRPIFPRYQNRMIPYPSSAAFQQSQDQWVQSRIDKWTDMLLSAYNLEHHKLAQKAIEHLTLGCDYPEQSFNTEDYPVPDDLLGKSSYVQTMMVSRIRENAAALRVKIKNVEIDF
jgi:hypothetical protein